MQVQGLALKESSNVYLSSLAGQLPCCKKKSKTDDGRISLVRREACADAGPP